MRRPQKPFIVEVKRARVGAVAKVLSGHDSATPAAIEPPSAPPKKPVVSPRRILEAIDPPPAAPAEALPPEPQWAESPVEIATKEAPRARSKNKPPAVDKAKVVPTRSRKVAPRPEPPVVIDPLPVILRPPTPETIVTRVAHANRVEAASDLPRGQRWKRRLPKSLW